MKLRILPLRWALDERGSNTVEMGLALGLFALIAAFGLFALGDALADFFFNVGIEFHNAALRIPGG